MSSQLSETCLPVHENVNRKIMELFGAGVRRVCEYRTLLENYIKNDLCAGQPTPPLSDGRFWPSNRYILGCISRLPSQSRFIFYRLWTGSCFVTIEFYVFLIVGNKHMFNMYEGRSINKFENSAESLSLKMSKLLNIRYAGFGTHCDNL